MYYLEKKIGVVVAEDEAVIRSLLVEKIKAADADFEVLASVEDGEAALEAVRKYNPQVVVTDIKMPKMDGIALARTLSLSFPTIKVVILSGYADFDYLQQSIRYGVFNYLLKPVEDEALTETLFDLKSSIISYLHTQNRTVIYSGSYSQHRREACLYALFIVCVGNLCYDVEDDLLEELYDRQLAPINWHGLLDTLYPGAQSWYLADEEAKNQKLICYSVQPGLQGDHTALAHTLQQALCAALPESIPVSVGTARACCEKDAVWMCAQRIRNVLKHKIIPAHGGCFLLEADEAHAPSDTLGILKMRIADNLRAVLTAKDTAGIRAELQLIFKYMSDNDLPQADWQRVILHILRMLEFSGIGFVDRQTEALRCLCRVNEPAKRTPALVSIMMNCLAAPEPAAFEDGDILERRLKAHLDENYLTLENLEDLTRTFPYSYAHLSRVFRKAFGQSMNRYVVCKKIALAKRMIENNEALNMGEISQMTGFVNSYYFSRVFKNVTGVSPTEYKSGLILKG